MPLASRHLFVIVFAISSLQTACAPGDKTAHESVQVGPPYLTKVTRETYLNGDAFCKTYASITSKEHPRTVTVPRSYGNRGAGHLQIYAYTLRPFDPGKPSVLFVDGGPGQNTHGMEETVGASVNEIHFDQRGLGCSAPQTYDIYSDVALYSTENNVLDMEEVRKAYGIGKMAVYGVSYGTVPATVYGSQFPQRTTAVVLEGVVGPTDVLHRSDYKVEKLNSVYSQLSASQKAAYADLIVNETAAGQTLAKAALQLFYANNGMRTYLKVINAVISTNGEVDTALIARLDAMMSKEEHKYYLAQQPMAVDENISDIIYCKNLNYRYGHSTKINFSKARGFFEEASTAPSGKACDEAHVPVSDEKLYRIEDYRTSVPVYYFQGSHDGATLAKGALQHWKTVPQGKSFFMLSQKGGHNPALSRVSKESSSYSEATATWQRLLFAEAFTGNDLLPEVIANLNSLLTAETRWILYRENQRPTVDTGFSKELEGIQSRPGELSDF